MRETATSLFGFVLVGAVLPFVSPAHADLRTRGWNANAPAAAGQSINSLPADGAVVAIILGKFRDQDVTIRAMILGVSRTMPGDRRIVVQRLEMVNLVKNDRASSLHLGDDARPL